MNATHLQERATQDLIDEFMAIAPESADHELTKHGRALWEQLQAIAKELLRRGAEPELLKLTEDPRIPVRFYAAELCYDVAPEVTRKVFETILADGSDKYFQRRAKFGLMIRFKDYLDSMRANVTPEEKVIQDRFFAFLKKAPPRPPKPPRK